MALLRETLGSRRASSSPGRGRSRILDDKGHFSGNRIREIKISPRLMRAIFREWCSQIERLVRLGASPSHFDAHHHVHTIPRMLPVLMALRVRYKIATIRISRNMYDGSDRLSESLPAKKRLYSFGLKACGFRTTRLFTDLATYVKLCGKEPPRAGSAELMTHPGSDPGGGEAKLLESDWPSSVVIQSDTHLLQELVVGII